MRTKVVRKIASTEAIIPRTTKVGSQGARPGDEAEVGDDPGAEDGGVGDDRPHAAEKSRDRAATRSLAAAACISCSRRAMIARTVSRDGRRQALLARPLLTRRVGIHVEAPGLAAARKVGRRAARPRCRWSRLSSGGGRGGRWRGGAGASPFCTTPPSAPRSRWPRDSPSAPGGRRSPGEEFGLHGAGPPRCTGPCSTRLARKRSPASAARSSGSARNRPAVRHVLGEYREVEPEMSETTTDHDVIRKWAEARGGRPARGEGHRRRRGRGASPRSRLRRAGGEPRAHRVGRVLRDLRRERARPRLRRRFREPLQQARPALGARRARGGAVAEEDVSHGPTRFRGA